VRVGRDENRARNGAFETLYFFVRRRTERRKEKKKKKKKKKKKMLLKRNHLHGSKGGSNFGMMQEKASQKG